MDGSLGVYMTYEEVLAFLRRSRPQVDRYRDPKYCADHRLPPFPVPIRPGGYTDDGRGLGSMLFLRHEIFDYASSRRLTPEPPTSASE
jgi:hypothetical protein